MKKIGPVFLLAICVLAIPLSAAAELSTGAGHADPHSGYVPGEVLVKFRAQNRGAALQGYRNRHTVRALRRFRSIGVDHLGLPASLTVAEALAIFRADPDVAYAEPNFYRYAAAVPYDEHFGLLWGLHNTGQTVNETPGTADADIDAPEAWEVTTGSDDVVVAVIDSGLDFSHPDLADNVWANPGEVPGNGLDDDGNGYVDDMRGWDFVYDDNAPAPNDASGHGTHVAGTIAAAGTTDLAGSEGSGVAGVSWQAQIMALRTLNAYGAGDTAAGVLAFEYATAMGADVINCSWGGAGYSQALKDAIDASPALVVCAAGNSGSDAGALPHYPAAYDSPNIVSVAATDANDNLAAFSNYGSVSVDVAAPGVNIYSCAPGRRAIWSDDFDDGSVGDWRSGGPNNDWGVTNAEAVSAPWSLADSPDGNYSQRTNSWIRAPELDLSGARNARFEFKLKGRSESGYDYLKVEVSTDGSVWIWKPVKLSGVGILNWVSGTIAGWTDALVDLSAYDGRSILYVRFALLSDWTNNYDGWYIDDVAVTAAADEYDGSEYRFLNGTSMAAPHVSGVAALVKGENPLLTAPDIKSTIAGTVDLKSALSGILTTGGRLNAFGAVNALNGGTLQFAAAAYSAEETAGSVTLSVTRTGGREGAVSVSYDVVGGTAAEGADYDEINGTLSWADGQSVARTFTVTLNNDTVYEGSETVQIALGTPTGGALPGSPSTTVLTILDDDFRPGTLQFAAAALTVDEDQGPALVTVTRTSGSDGAVSVDYATAGGSAQAGSDYTAASGTLSWDAGDDQPQTFQVPVIDDTALEEDETVVLTLSNPQGGATLGSPAGAVLTIVENDPVMPGTVEFSAPAYTIDENETGASAVITATRTDGSDGAVSVSYVASNGTATDGVDYTAVSGNLAWADGDAGAKTFAVPVHDDDLYEPDETVILTLADPTGGLKLGELSSAVLTIVDDDARPGTLQFSATAYPVLETAGNAMITVTRTGGSDGAVSVGYTTADGTALAGSDYTDADGTLTWGDGDGSARTFTVVILVDFRIEGDETVTLALNSPTGGAALGSPATASLTISDAQDTDGDGVPQSLDNCTAVANTDQLDTDGDGYGNRCDGDLNNDGSTNTLDLQIYRGMHDTHSGDSAYDPNADFDGDSFIDDSDLDIYRGLHRRPPGPSCCGD